MNLDRGRRLPNIAVIMKDEILRLARKEVRKETENLKKASANFRSEIATLKRRLAALEKLSTNERRRVKTPAIGTEEAEAVVKIRFSAARMSKHRKNLRLSAAEYGRLLGVSAQTVYNWEAGKSRPRQSQLQAIAAVRKLGKRQIKTLLATS